MQTITLDDTAHLTAPIRSYREVAKIMRENGFPTMDHSSVIIAERRALRKLREKLVDLWDYFDG